MFIRDQSTLKLATLKHRGRTEGSGSAASNKTFSCGFSVIFFSDAVYFLSSSTIKKCFFGRLKISDTFSKKNIGYCRWILKREHPAQHVLKPRYSVMSQRTLTRCVPCVCQRTPCVKHVLKLQSISMSQRTLTRCVPCVCQRTPCVKHVLKLRTAQRTPCVSMC